MNSADLSSWRRIYGCLSGIGSEIKLSRQTLEAEEDILRMSERKCCGDIEISLSF
jgi:hypothetical protein